MGAIVLLCFPVILMVSIMITDAWGHGLEWVALWSLAAVWARWAWMFVADASGPPHKSGKFPIRDDVIDTQKAEIRAALRALSKEGGE
jgi:hypothetical protein